MLAAGYAPAIGFIHTGKPLSFVYDIGDLVKFETVVPLAFEQAAKVPFQPAKWAHRWTTTKRVFPLSPGTAATLVLPRLPSAGAGILVLTEFCDESFEFS